MMCTSKLGKTREPRDCDRGGGGGLCLQGVVEAQNAFQEPSNEAVRSPKCSEYSITQNSWQVKRNGFGGN